MSKKHESWYKKTYGNFEGILALVAWVEERIADKIHKLETDGKLWSKSTATKPVAPFTTDDVEALIAAAKAHGIY